MSYQSCLIACDESCAMSRAVVDCTTMCSVKVVLAALECNV